MTKLEFAKVMAVMSAAAGKEARAEQVEAYFELLKDIPLPVLKEAATRALMENQYPTIPPIGVIRKHAVDVLIGESLTAEEAWGKVIQAVRIYGYTANIRDVLESLPDPVARAVETIGWLQICDSTNPEVLRAQFRGAFEKMAAKEAKENLRPERMPSLVARWKALQLEKKDLPVTNEYGGFEIPK